MAGTTERLYAAAQEQFREWCEYRRVTFPPADHAVIANYLRECIRRHGPAATRLRVAALGRMYRSAGVPLDRQSPVILLAMRPAKARR